MSMPPIGKDFFGRDIGHSADCSCAECREADRKKSLIQALSEKNALIAALQAKVDSLMLEYCPDEMTPGQVAEWGRNQRRVSPEREAEITAALDIRYGDAVYVR